MGEHEGPTPRDCPECERLHDEIATPPPGAGREAAAVWVGDHGVATGGNVGVGPSPDLRALVDAFLVGIERGFAHWEAIDPQTGEAISGDPTVVILNRETWLPEVEKLRAALTPPASEPE